MLLHICNDEKFIDVAIEQFEKVSPRQNDFFILVDELNSPLKFIKQIDKVTKITTNTFSIPQSRYQAVLIHYLENRKIEIVNKLPSGIPLVWMFWGQDAQKSFTDYNYKPYTQRLVLKLFGWNEYLLPYTNWVKRMLLPFKARGKAMRKFEFCAPVIKNELLILNKKLGLNLEYLDFTYGTLEHYTNNIKNLKATGSNIIIGNSSSAVCNHLESFDAISKYNLQGKKIIVPLSYGNEDYKEFIIKEGHKRFEDRFSPIIEFMDLHSYNNLLTSCSIAIMNHNRQQALGNILVLLWLGVKIFMDPINPLYQNLLERGYIIYDVNSIGKISQEELFSPISKDEILYNRSLLYRDYNEQVVLNKTKLLIDTITSK